MTQPSLTRSTPTPLGYILPAAFSYRDCAWVPAEIVEGLRPQLLRNFYTRLAEGGGAEEGVGPLGIHPAWILVSGARSIGKAGGGREAQGVEMRGWEHLGCMGWLSQLGQVM
jgi:hypothetical protein